jgi:hypothetical protein
MLDFLFKETTKRLIILGYFKKENLLYKIAFLLKVPNL